MKTYMYIFIYDHISLDSYKNAKYSRQNCTENQNTHFMFNIFTENCAVYEITWENILQSRTDHRRQ